MQLEIHAKTAQWVWVKERLRVYLLCCLLEKVMCCSQNGRIAVDLEEHSMKWRCEMRLAMDRDRGMAMAIAYGIQWRIYPYEHVLNALNGRQFHHICSINTHTRHCITHQRLDQSKLVGQNKKSFEKVSSCPTLEQKKLCQRHICRHICECNRLYVHVSISNRIQTQINYFFEFSNQFCQGKSAVYVCHVSDVN